MRHELKYLISVPSAAILKSMLRACMTPDGHYKKGSYTVRSLYFDDLYAGAFFDKLDGGSEREKFRLRLYNSDDGFIVFEKKIKKNDMTDKISETVSRSDAEKILSGHAEGGGNVSREFSSKKELRPAIVIEYLRTAFTYPAQHTRITVDERLRFSDAGNFFEKKPPSIYVPNDGKVILEVKFDDVFPDFLSPILGSVPSERISVSKYAICREIQFN